MKYFENCRTIEDVKKEYKRLAKELHPDLNPDKDTTKQFQEMQNEYEKAFEKYKNVHTNAKGETYKKENNETPKEYAETIEKLIKMNGIKIEIIGSFIWVSGNTKEYKEQLKELKFLWSSNKKMWYLKPKDYKKRNGITYSIENIRSMFGTEEIETEQRKLAYN